MQIIKNINDFLKAKKEKTPVTMITCYDYSFARIINESDIDVILVGDSLGNVIAGYDTTLPVTVDQMIYHSSIVRRGAPDKFIVTDLPFMSYHISIEDTLRNCGRIMKETGSNAVKLEGGEDFSPAVKAIVKASIPVMGHLGLTPQSVHKLGGYSVQGREEDVRNQIISDALKLEDSGVFSIVLEMVPEPLAEEVSKRVDVPVIGIGAGRYCDGQVLVMNDMLGLNSNFSPRFLKKYADFHQSALDAFNSYNHEVKKRKFPEEKHVFK